MDEFRIVPDAEGYETGAEVVVTVFAANELLADATELVVDLCWETRGKGDADREVVQKVKIEPHSSEWFRDNQTTLTLTLPLSPPTYDGVLIHIEWMIKARLKRPGILRRGTECKVTIQVGAVDPVQMLDE